jgi:hypothetical protein
MKKLRNSECNAKEKYAENHSNDRQEGIHENVKMPTQNQKHDYNDRGAGSD